MYIMKTSKEFESLHLTVNEVVKGLNKYFDGPSIDNVRFYSADIDYTYCYSPKCCLSAAILWLHEQGVDYFCGMPVPCKEAKESPVQVRNVLSADIKIEPDALPELIVKMALWDGTFDNILIDSICDDLIQYISKYGEQEQEDNLCERAHELKDQIEKAEYEHEYELINLKKKIVSALGISLSDRKIAIDDHSKLHNFSYLIKLIEHQTRSYENASMLLDKTNTRCTELEDRVEKSENKQKELILKYNTIMVKYNTLRRELIDALGGDDDA